MSRQLSFEEAGQWVEITREVYNKCGLGSDRTIEILQRADERGALDALLALIMLLPNVRAKAYQPVSEIENARYENRLRLGAGIRSTGGVGGMAYGIRRGPNIEHPPEPADLDDGENV
jgi:hypothetical protein